MNEQITFESLPKAVGQILEEMSFIRQFLSKKESIIQPEPHRWFDLNELIEYDPEKRSKATFYGYIHTRSIPFHKKHKKLIFLKSEIDEWIKNGRRKTNEETSKEASLYLQKYKK